MSDKIACWPLIAGVVQVEVGLACANILLTGGNMKFPQVRERFEREIRSLVPIDFPVHVRSHELIILII
jgi:actin-related protein